MCDLDYKPEPPKARAWHVWVDDKGKISSATPECPNPELITVREVLLEDE